METKLQKIDDIFSLTQEKLDVDKIRTLLEMFNFNIPEEQLQYIRINSLTKWRISFTNNFTKEICFGYYTSECPAYGSNFRYSGEEESFLGQKIQSDSVIKMNWFYVKGNRYSDDAFTLEPTYIPPYKRNRSAIIEEAIFNGKNADGEFVLHIQKDYPYSDKKKNFEVEIFKGNFDEVYPGKLKDVLEPNNTRKIVRIKYGINEDYNYFETGSISNRGNLKEIRYIYGRNMSGLTDYEYRRNNLVDTRLVYGVDHNEHGGTTYHGVISEDGTNKFKNIRPVGMTHLASPLQLLENSEKKPISKIYFQGYDKTSGQKSLGILKTKNGINIVRDEMQYDESGDFRKRADYQRTGEYVLPSISEGTITIEEIKSAISLLRDKSPNGTFVKSICNELEMFIERKIERKELSNMEFQVSDICIPNLTVHFDTDLIIDMIIKQGVGNSISKILESYSDMFRNDKQAVINCNRENEKVKSK